MPSRSKPGVQHTQPLQERSVNQRSTRLEDLASDAPKVGQVGADENQPRRRTRGIRPDYSLANYFPDPSNFDDDVLSDGNYVAVPQKPARPVKDMTETFTDSRPRQIKPSVSTRRRHCRSLAEIEQEDGPEVAARFRRQAEEDEEVDEFLLQERAELNPRKRTRGLKKQTAANSSTLDFPELKGRIEKRKKGWKPPGMAVSPSGPAPASSSAYGSEVPSDEGDSDNDDESDYDSDSQSQKAEDVRHELEELGIDQYFPEDGQDLEPQQEGDLDDDAEVELTVQTTSGFATNELGIGAATYAEHLNLIKQHLHTGPSTFLSSPQAALHTANFRQEMGRIIDAAIVQARNDWELRPRERAFAPTIHMLLRDKNSAWLKNDLLDLFTPAAQEVFGRPNITPMDLLELPEPSAENLSRWGVYVDVVTHTSGRTAVYVGSSVSKDGVYSRLLAYARYKTGMYTGGELHRPHLRHATDNNCTMNFRLVAFADKRNRSPVPTILLEGLLMTFFGVVTHTITETARGQLGNSAIRGFTNNNSATHLAPDSWFGLNCANALRQGCRRHRANASSCSLCSKAIKPKALTCLTLDKNGVGRVHWGCYKQHSIAQNMADFPDACGECRSWGKAKSCNGNAVTKPRCSNCIEKQARKTIPVPCHYGKQTGYSRAQRRQQRIEDKCQRCAKSKRYCADGVPSGGETPCHRCRLGGRLCWFPKKEEKPLQRAKTPLTRMPLLPERVLQPGQTYNDFTIRELVNILRVRKIPGPKQTNVPKKTLVQRIEDFEKEAKVYRNHRMEVLPGIWLERYQSYGVLNRDQLKEIKRLRGMTGINAVKKQAVKDLEEWDAEHSSTIQSIESSSHKKRRRRVIVEDESDEGKGEEEQPIQKPRRRQIVDSEAEEEE